MQIYKDLSVILYSQRSDMKTFCQWMFEGFTHFSVEPELNKINLNPNQVTVFDAHLFTIIDPNLFITRYKNAFRKSICLLPFELPYSIKKFVASYFFNIIPVPINKDYFLSDFMEYENKIQFEFLKPDEEDEFDAEEEKLFKFLQGNSKLIRHVRSEIVRLSELDSPVLITGETGTGKTTAAKLIHRLSSRRHGSYVERSISNTEEALADSHFFGAEAWSYTGAKTTKGWFQIADTGTLFLDEIGTASLGIQSKLLTVLDNGKVTKVGGEKSLKVDVRMIFATNSNLEIMIDNKTFREDLYYRINKNKLNIPPLRERPEDIGIIAEVIAKKNGKNLLPDTIAKLEQLPWYGNVRELDTVIQNTCEKVHEKDISVDQLRFS